ncbi:MAG TPA: cytochrome c nitrite reductase small subunit [Candidatus Eisenbacteria bacterium]|nr:cytochrome c nitrite reductase small subunit [Candidatus Eisenbacteria bacterium]
MRLQRSVLAPVALGALLGLGGYTAFYAEGLSYLSSDPEACVNCHVMRDPYDSWRKSTHHAVAVCVDCHLPHDFVGKYAAKIRNGYFHSKGFTLQDFPEPIRITPANAAILQRNCAECHESLVSGILAGHGQHSQEIACVRCHRTAGHGG